MDRKIDAGAAQRPRPVGDRLRLEQELRGDETLKPMRLDIGLLPDQRVEKHALAMDLGDVRVALRMTGEADACHAIGFEDARLEKLDRGVIAAEGLGRAAAQHQHGRGPRLGQRLDAASEISLIAHKPRRDMRHRHEAGGRELARGLDLAGEVGRVDECHEHPASGGQAVLEQRQLLDLLRRDFDRLVTQKGGGGRGGGQAWRQGRGIHGARLRFATRGPCARPAAAARMFATAP